MNLVTDYQELAKTMELPPEALDLITGSGIRSVMHCPLVSGDTVFGALTLATNGTRTFTEADAVFGEELGRRVGTVLANLQLHERLANRLRGQEAVARLGQAAVVLQAPEPLFEAPRASSARSSTATSRRSCSTSRRATPCGSSPGPGWRDGVVGHAMIPDNAGSHSGFALISDGPVVSTDYATESTSVPARSCSSTAHDRASRHPSSARTGRGASSASTASRRAASRRTRSRSSTPSRTSSAAPSAVAAWRSRSATVTTASSSRLRPRRPASGSGTSSPGGSSGPTRSAGCTACRPAPSPELDAYLALVHEDDRGWVGERIHRAAETGAYDAQFRIVHPDGTVRWTHGTAKVFFDPQHKAIRMIGVARDVTEEVELEGERLRMAEAERRQTELNQAFIGVVSHELRTPITSIYGGSKLLRRMGEEQSEKRSELTADIEAEAERLYRLTEDLLVLTRVERGTLDIGLRAGGHAARARAGHRERAGALAADDDRARRPARHSDRPR